MLALMIACLVTLVWVLGGAILIEAGKREEEKNMTAFSTWNINMQAIPNRQEFYDHLVWLQPSYLLGMNGLKELMGLREILPYTQFIHRWKVEPPQGGTHPDNDDNPMTLTPEEWVARRNRNLSEAGLKPGDVWLYTNNESGHSDALLRWLQRVIELAVPLGHKLVIYNGSVGTPGPDPVLEWSKPEAKKLLELCAIHSGQVILGLHEYGGGIVTSGFIGGLPTALEDVHPDYTNPANWPGKAEAADMTMWHVGRYKFVNHVRPGVRIGITEYAPCDRINSGGYDEWLKTLPVSDGYQEIRGPLTARKWWEHVFPGLSAEEAVALQDGYAQEVIYADSNVEFMARFTMSAAKDWVAAGFGYGIPVDGWSPEVYYSLIESYGIAGTLKGRTWDISNSPTIPVDPPPIIDPPALPTFPADFGERSVPARLLPVGHSLRIRLKPTTSAAILGVIPDGGVDGAYIPEDALREDEVILDTADGANGIWIPVQTGEMSGWVFGGLLRVEEALPLIFDRQLVTALIDSLQAGVDELRRYFDQLTED